MNARSADSIDVTLRDPHVAYLERLAEREEISVSAAFANILEQRAIGMGTTERPPRKARKHFSITEPHLALLDRLTVRLGLKRSDVARRLIDWAMAEEQSR